MAIDPSLTRGAGEFVEFPYDVFFDDGPVALGWLRASHRELKKERYTEYQPVLVRRRELKIEKDEIVPLESKYGLRERVSTWARS